MNSIPNELNLELTEYKLYTKIMLIIWIILIFICLYSCFFAISLNTDCTCGCNYSKKCNCTKEHFDNLYTKIDNSNNYITYNVAQLTPTDNDTLIFGQANRYLIANSDGSKPLKYILNVTANLYLLNGNPFGSIKTSDNTIISQNYYVYLKNDKKSILIDKLNVNSSQLYSLEFSTTEPSTYISYNEIYITYKTNNNEQIILNGKFN